MTQQKNNSTTLTIRQLDATDAVPFREVRLEGLHTHPESFSSSYDDERAEPLSSFEDWLENSIVFGGYNEENTLLGIASFIKPTMHKQCHKGKLTGIYVRPQARGTGLAKALISQLIATHAEGVVEEILLTVGAFNAPAITLYKSLGFKEYGLEKRALKVGDTYYDELLMALPLNPTCK
ncbi:MAG: N-acetyltransferase [Sneathiella sp.]